MQSGAPQDRGSHSASRLTWLIAVLMSANLVWTTLELGGYRPETKLVSFTLTAAALVVLLLQRSLRPAAPRWHPFGYALLPFVAWAGWNVLVVTPVRWLGGFDWLGWTQLAAVVWLSLNALGAPGPRRLVLGTACGLGVVAVALACYQRAIDPDWLMMGRTQSSQFAGRASGPFGIPNSLGALMVLLLPPAAGFALSPRNEPRRRVLAAAAVAVFALGLLLSVSRGAWLALGLTLAAWPLFEPHRPWARRLALSAGLGVFLAAAAGLAYGLNDGVRDRLDAFVADSGERTRPLMWRGAWALFNEQPFTGTGAGSYNVLFERHRPAGFRDDPQWAHNDFLNTLSDYGLAGFALAFAVPAGVAAWLRRRYPSAGDGSVRPVAMGLLAFGLTLLVDFHLKLPALASFAALAVAESVRPCGAPRGRRRQGPVVRVAAGVAALLLGAVFAAGPWPALRAEAQRYGARRALDALAEGRREAASAESLVAGAAGRFGRAVLLDPANAQAWSDLSYAESLAARFRPEDQAARGAEAERAARRALEIAPVVPEFWWRLGVALDMQGRREEAGAVFAHALGVAPHHPHGWYYQGYHFSLSPATRPLARASLAICLRLDPGYGPAESLLAELQAAP